MAILFLVAGLLYLLYLGGMLPISAKRAVSFIGTGERGRMGASFTDCHGSIHKIIRFRESRSYSFCLSGHVQQGSVTVELLDARRTRVLMLTADSPSGILSVQRGARYSLYLRFDHASGDYQLDIT